MPLKGRPKSSWGVDPPLTAEPLLKKEGSILGLHLTSRHLLIMYASYPQNTAAAAVWLDSNTLEPVQELALPADVSYIWAENGLQKMLISTYLGDVYTMCAQPQASHAETAPDATFKHNYEGNFLCICSRGTHVRRQKSMCPLANLTHVVACCSKKPHRRHT